MSKRVRNGGGFSKSQVLIRRYSPPPLSLLFSLPPSRPPPSVLLNALVRQNPSLLEKGLCPLVLLPQCRAFLDFENKKAYFRTQVWLARPPSHPPSLPRRSVPTSTTWVRHSRVILLPPPPLPPSLSPSLRSTKSRSRSIGVSTPCSFA